MLEDVAVIACLSLFGDHSAMGIVPEEEKEQTLELMNSALRVSASQLTLHGLGISEKARDADGHNSGGPAVVLAFRFVRQSGPKDGINSYVFPMASAPKWEEAGRGAHIPRVIYARLDECV